MKLLQGLLPDLDLLKKLFRTTLDMRNANKVQENFCSKQYER